MEKYIKFEEWNEESLKRACNEAERMGNEKEDIYNVLKFEWHWVLKIENWEYFTSIHSEQKLIKLWHTEHKLFTEWEKVYVSDESEKDALIIKDKRIYLWTFWKINICVNSISEKEYKNWKYFMTNNWKYIVKIEKSKTLTIKTEDWQSLNITEEKAKEIGFKINIE